MGSKWVNLSVYLAVFASRVAALRLDPCALVAWLSARGALWHNWQLEYCTVFWDGAERLTSAKFGGPRHNSLRRRVATTHPSSTEGRF